MQETWVKNPWVWEDHLEKEMATHCSILAWETTWTEEPGRLQFMGLQELDTTSRLKGFPGTSDGKESEKGKWSCSVVSSSLRPHGL